MKTTKLIINLLAISLTALMASSAFAGNLTFFSEYLGRETTPHEELAVIAADREIQREPVVISSTDKDGLTYSSEYMAGDTTLALEARTKELDREIMAKPDVIKGSIGLMCKGINFSAYKCL